MLSFIPFRNLKPQIEEEVFIAKGAYLIGDVQIGRRSSVWFHSVLRGDVLPIRVGRGTNIQDLSLIHTSSGVTPAIIGDEVTVGHRVILHGCEVGNRVIVGMGAILMDGVKIGEDCIIGAGSLVTENTIIPSRTLALGSPCRVKRELTEQEIQFIQLSALHYQQRAEEYG